MKKSTFLSTAAGLWLLVPTQAYAADNAAHAAGNNAAADTAAQPAPESTASASGANGDTIIVTARRRAEDAARVPISITAFNTEALQRANVHNLLDVGRIAPGITINSAGTRANPYVTIRGQTKGITGNINPGVITYVNDVPLPNGGSLIPTYDIQNIQVLRGPQGTLFGRNALGGAVLINSIPPSHDFSGYAQIEEASYSFTQFEGALNVPIGSAIALRVATQLFHDGGATPTQVVTPYVVNQTTGIITSGTIVPARRNIDEFDGRAVRASLLIEPTDWFRNVTVVEYTNFRGLSNNQLNALYPTGYQGGPPAIYYRDPAIILGALGPTIGQNVINLAQCGRLECDWRLVQSYFLGTPNFRGEIIDFDPDAARMSTTSLTNTTTLRLSDAATLKNIFGYRHVSFFTPVDNDGNPLVLVNAFVRTNIEQVTDELQLSGDLFNHSLRYTLGGFYYLERPAGPGGTQGLEVNSLFGLSHSLAYTFLHNKSQAIYGQLDYSPPFLPGLTLTAGARETWDSVSGCSGSGSIGPRGPETIFDSADTPNVPTEAACRSNTVTAPFQVAAPVSQLLPERKFDALTYTFGANWQVTQGIMLYAVHRRGYRAGSYNTPLFNQAFLGQIQAFGPETLTDWEVGAKIRWRSGGMHGSFDLALFSGKDNNTQLPVNTGTLTAGFCVPEAAGFTGVTACTTTLANSPGSTPGQAGGIIAHPAATTVLSAGAMTIRGFEASASISPVAGLTLNGGVGYVDYKVDRITLDSNLFALLRAARGAAAANSAATLVLTQQPKWTLNAALEYAFPQKVLSGDLSFNFSVRHVTTWISAGTNIFAPAFTVADARLGLGNIGNSGLSVALYVNNLFNNYYFNGFAGGAPQALGEITQQTARPRIFGISARYNFGS